MNEIRGILPPKIYEVIDRAGICTLKQILTLSNWDIKKLTNLNKDDIILLKNLVAEHTHPVTKTCLKLKQESNIKVTSGCGAIDMLLDGGFRKGTITEIYGESGCGKTQIGLQAVAHNWPNKSVYICTEDVFPVKRFDEVKRSIPGYKINIDYGSTTFVEHITESQDLLSCVRVRLSKLLKQNGFTLVVIDSVAAPFRVENTNYVQRAEEMRELAISILGLAQDFDLAVLCMNQVTAAFNSSTDILPSLGLAWSNMVSTRLCLTKTSEVFRFKNKNDDIESFSHVREISVVFAPNLANWTTKFVILSEGLQGHS